MVMLEIQVQSDLGRLAERVRKFRDRVKGDLLNRVAQRIAKQARDRIRTVHASPDGVPWPPRVGVFSHPPLRRSGALLRSIRSARESKELINIGSDLEYAPFQQKGTRRGIAAREFLGVGESDEAELQQVIDSWVEGRF